MLKIFEVKLYGFSPEKFEEKIEEKRTEFYCKHKDQKELEAKLLYSRLYRNKNLYHNYSIGFLEILYDGYTLLYEAKIMLSKKYPAEEKTKKLLYMLELDDTIPEKEKDAKKAAIIESCSYVPYKIRLFSEKKVYMSTYRIDGLRTYVFEKSNSEIASIIKADVNKIQKDPLLKDVYFDLSNFNYIIDCIDFNTLFRKYDLSMEPL